MMGSTKKDKSNNRPLAQADTGANGVIQSHQAGFFDTGQTEMGAARRHFLHYHQANNLFCCSAKKQGILRREQGHRRQIVSKKTLIWANGAKSPGI